ncbi:MAG TPA: glycosyltransferase [Lacipirellulaceae bacterium]|nr:glycosyltransferase [Lacipirellulaceae bacterium]
MIKAANALADARYCVTVIASEFSAAWKVAGEQILKHAKWKYQGIDWSSRADGRLRKRPRIRRKACQTFVDWAPPQAIPLATLAKATNYVAPEMMNIAKFEPADLYYGGTACGLATCAMIARTLRRPYALDLEDFHTGEMADTRVGRASNRLMRLVQDRTLGGASFLTAGSSPIAQAYYDDYALQPIPINNVFPLPPVPPDFSPRANGALSLVWFSQPIGPGRGLECAIEACKLAQVRVHLRLLGASTPFVAQLYDETRGSQVRVEVLPPCPPEDIAEFCRMADVGLALETGQPLNRDLCLTNKILTYPLAGLAILATSTTAQRELAADFGEGMALYSPGDAHAFARVLRRWAADTESLIRARQASWHAARQRWHWDHPMEKGQLLEAVAKVIGDP